MYSRIYNRENNHKFKFLMTKKTFYIKPILLIAFILNLFLTTAYAEQTILPPTEEQIKSDMDLGIIDVNELMPPLTETSQVYQETRAVANLPEMTLEQTVTSVLKTIFGLASVICLIGIVAAGIYYVAFGGDEAKVGLAKQTIVYLIIGFFVMAAAYGIVNGILQLQFFENP